MMHRQLSDSLKLKSGNKVANRLVKAAMSENMANKDHSPDQRFERLYTKWGEGGAGLLITGNVMVDRNHLGEAHNVVLDQKNIGYQALVRWAKAAQIHHNLVYMQLNHPGKQTPKFLTSEPVAPSAIGYQSHLKHMFNKPKALTVREIKAIIQKFTLAAQVAEKAGFNGIQIHGAHGYLVSQFLSPLHNQRQDQWGGSLENRMRFLVEIIKSIQLHVKKSFGIALKLNSADFQKGGFTEDEALEVVKKLDQFDLDFIEISGGSYESAAMVGKKKKSTLKREAYFLEFAERVCQAVETPIMVTGGFRKVDTMKKALESGVDLIGLGRPFCVDTNLGCKILSGEIAEIELDAKETGVESVDKSIPLEILWYTGQIHRIGAGRSPQPNKSVWLTVIDSLFRIGLTGLMRVRAQ